MSCQAAHFERQANHKTKTEGTTSYMPEKEAAARIKINKLLETAGWRFFADGKSPANIQLEPSVTLKSSDLDALGENFEKASKGFIDFLLLDAGASRSSSWRPNRRTRTRSSARSRPANMPDPRTAASSSSPTATCITSGTLSAAIPT